MDRAGIERSLPIAVRAGDLRHRVEDLGFVGAHWYPHRFAMPPTAPQVYPYYAKCCDLDIPIMMQVGQNLVYSRERRLPSVAKPIMLDQVAIDFPDLLLLGIHIGVPWTDEMISMCWKHPNVYTAGDRPRAGRGRGGSTRPAIRIEAQADAGERAEGLHADPALSRCP
jgi:predicted TIM-barrel fold metal-dependent hydrolase